MTIQVKVNTSTDITNFVQLDSLEIEQILTSEIDTARFTVKKYGSRSYAPVIGQDVTIWNDGQKIFGGTITNIEESVVSLSDGISYDVQVSDYTYLLDSKLVSKVYENKTLTYIINDLISSYAPGFTASVTSTFVITKIVFNQVPISDCIKRLASIMRYDWYVDQNKVLKFFSKFTDYVPFDITDTNGKAVTETLKRVIDGTQIVNVVKVRGGEYNGALYTDKITVNGSNSKSFVLPYRYANLTIKLNTVVKTVGIDFIDSFSTKDVLYNYNEKTIRFQSNLTDGDIIEYSGNPKTPVLAIASDPDSIATYGQKEKLIRDNTIEDINIARKRAQAELEVYKDGVQTVEFDSYTPGMRSGYVLSVKSTRRGLDYDFIINRITFKARTKDDFFYSVQLVNTKSVTFIELLQRLLAPDPMQADESEVAEDVKTDTETIRIDEEINKNVGPQDNVEITISENIQTSNSLSPIYVVGNYIPSGITDPLRNGLIGYTFQIY